jgi:hypothetical protein
MSLFISRKVFLVVAGGNTSAQQHFEDTIQRKRTLEEVKRFLLTQEIENWKRSFPAGVYRVGCSPRSDEKTDGRR